MTQSLYTPNEQWSLWARMIGGARVGPWIYQAHGDKGYLERRAETFTRDCPSISTLLMPPWEKPLQARGLCHRTPRAA